MESDRGNKVTKVFFGATQASYPHKYLSKFILHTEGFSVLHRQRDSGIKGMFLIDLILTH